MARRRNNELYRLRKGKSFYGTWRYYSPVSHEVIDLGTPDRDLAERLYAESRKTLESGAAPGSPTAGAAAINAWIDSATSEADGPVDVVPDGASDPVVEPAQVPIDPLPPAAIAVVPSTRKRRGLTPQQIARMSNVVQRLAARIDVVGLEALMRMSGRRVRSDAIDEDDLELLGVGLELMLEDLFVKNPPKPWMIVTAANGLLAFKMYLRSDPEPKTEPTSVDQPAKS